MGMFTLVPVWVIQDVIVIILAVITVLFIIRKEEHPGPVILEFICFVFLNAAVFENFATLMGWYGYGRSVLMLFNVPLSVPILEYLVVYSSLRILSAMKIRTWCKPFIVGVFGMLLDLSLDPLAVRQVFETQERTIGRWTWFYDAGAVNIFRIPVYNFSGWVLLCGYAAAFLLLGRWWYRKSGFSFVVGYLYPILGMIASLGILVTPLSNFLLWLAPFMGKGSASEWFMCVFYLIFAAALLLLFWRGRMLRKLSFADDAPIFLVFAVIHVSNIIFALIGGYHEILWLQILAGVTQISLILLVYIRGKGLRRRLRNSIHSLADPVPVKTD
jgi:hypothetical protein